MVVVANAVNIRRIIDMISGHGPKSSHIAKF